MDYTKYIITFTVFFIILVLETFFPLFSGRKKRWLHAGRNISIIVVNNIVVLLLLSSVTAFIFQYASLHRWGVFYYVQVSRTLRLVFVIIVFDLWMYLWHRMAHQINFIWRFHRMHHTDTEMDVTTALRFHPGEIVLSTMLRWGVFLLLGMTIADLVIYETIMLPVIFLQHSNFYLPHKVDRLLRMVIVTPWMHWVHHSHIRDETNSNYGTIFSWWDRLGKTFRLREKPAAIQYGLDEFHDPSWQTVAGMLKTPVVSEKQLEIIGAG